MLRDTDPLATESKDVSMCLAIPGQIVSIDTSGSLRMGRADFGGVVQEI
ncbi:MAG: HypC/HybG/HupF family hydrogenase formation chaperone, partial [Pirellula sp.]